MPSDEYPLVQVFDEKRGYSVWVESEPEACPKCGASWAEPYTMRRGWVACSDHEGHSGHRTWRCVACDEMTLSPPHEGELAEERWKIFR